MRLSKQIRTLAIAAVIGAVGCSKDKTADNAALQNDLTLAAQQQTRTDSISALEAGTATKTAPVSNLSSTRRTTTSSAPRRTTSPPSGSSASPAGTARG